jgi:hypothetical protein
VIPVELTLQGKRSLLALLAYFVLQSMFNFGFRVSNLSAEVRLTYASLFAGVLISSVYLANYRAPFLKGDWVGRFQVLCAQTGANFLRGAAFGIPALAGISFYYLATRPGPFLFVLRWLPERLNATGWVSFLTSFIPLVISFAAQEFFFRGILFQNARALCSEQACVGLCALLGAAVNPMEHFGPNLVLGIFAGVSRALNGSLTGAIGTQLISRFALHLLNLP